MVSVAGTSAELQTTSLATMWRSLPAPLKSPPIVRLWPSRSKLPVRARRIANLHNRRGRQGIIDPHYQRAAGDLRRPIGVSRRGGQNHGAVHTAAAANFKRVIAVDVARNHPLANRGRDAGVAGQVDIAGPSRAAKTQRPEPDAGRLRPARPTDRNVIVVWRVRQVSARTCPPGRTSITAAPKFSGQLSSRIRASSTVTIAREVGIVAGQVIVADVATPCRRGQ